MSIEEVFLVDSNAFITPYRNYYQFSFAPTFWEQFNTNCSSGRILTLDKVEKELCKEIDPEKKDDMQIWLEDTFEGQEVSSLSQEVLGKYAQVINHLQTDDKYSEKALNEWTDIKVADPWLIAVAMEHGYTIVSFEKGINIQPNTKVSRAKIPNVCDDLGVSYCSLFEMMIKLGFSL